MLEFQYRFTLRFVPTDAAISETLTLADEPRGWDGTAVSLRRSLQYYGVFSQYTASLQFVGDGYSFLKRIYDTHGHEAMVYVDIEIIDEFQAYRPLFTGLINFSKAKISPLVSDYQLGQFNADAYFFEAPVDPAGLEMTMRNRENVEFDLQRLDDIDGNALNVGWAQNSYKQVYMHSKQLFLQSEIFFDQLQDFPVNFGIIPLALFRYIQLPYPVTLDEAETMLTPTFAFESAKADLPAIFVARYDGDYAVDLAFTGEAIPQVMLLPLGGSELKFWISWGEVNGDNETLLFSSGFLNDGDIAPFNFVFNQVLSLKAGQRIFLCWRIEGKETFNSIIKTFAGSYCRISQDSEQVGTATPVYPVFETLSKSVEILTGAHNALISDYYGRRESFPSAYPADGCGALKGITNGFLLRGISNNSHPKLTFADLFNSLNAIDNIGLGFERFGGIEFVRIEPKSYFFRNAEILRLDNVPNIERTFAAELVYNQVKIGYDKADETSIRTIDEFNTERVYNNDFRRTSGEYAQLSKLIGSGYAIEAQRRLQFALQERGGTFDNENFIVCLSRINKVRILEIRPSDADVSIRDQSIKVVATEVDFTAFGSEIRDTAASDGNYDILQILPTDTPNAVIVVFTTTVPPGAPLNGYLWVFNNLGLSTEKDESFGAITNLYSPATAYNLRISPVRNLLRHTNWINGGMWKYPQKGWRFGTGRQNFKLTTVLLGGGCDDVLSVTIAENGDYTVQGTLPALFVPEFLTFKARISVEQYLTLINNRTGYIAVSDTDSGHFTGWLWQMEFNHKDYVAEFVLLRRQ